MYEWFTLADNSKFVEFIYREMQKRDMSQRQFAEFVGISQSALSRAMRPIDPTSLSLETLIKIAKATHTSITSLIVMIFPEVADVADLSAEDRILAERISKLPPDKQEVVEAMILGMLLQTRDGEG